MIYIYIFICCFFIFNIFGCAATLPKDEVSISSHAPVINQPAAPTSSSAGMYHKVEKGQTLWRIADIYNVDVDDIIKANRLSDIAKIEVGQKIFIPKKKERYRLNNRESAHGKKIALSEFDFIWPVKGDIISFYNAKSDSVLNKGIDIKAPEGFDIKASKSGIVSFCDDNVVGFGKTIIIDHRDGFSTVYAHNSANLVKMGQLIEQGMYIAKVGSTGRANTSYLHFEIRKKGKAQNPFYYLP